MTFTLYGFIISSIIVTIIPGMTVTLIITNTLGYGLKAGLLTVLGGVAAVFSMVLVLATGFQIIVQEFRFIFTYIQLLGGIYLIWIGMTMFLNSDKQDMKNFKPKYTNFTAQGFFLMWSNPKTLVFLGAFLPQFVEVQSNVSFQVLFFGLVFTFFPWFSDSMYAVFINYINRFLANQRSLINKISGISILCIGLFLLFF